MTVVCLNYPNGGGNLLQILLCCSGGFSSGLLVAKVKKAAAQRGLQVDADFIGISPLYFLELAGRADVVLFGPQVRLLIRTQTGFLKQKSIPWAIMDTLAYARGDGEKVLDQALALLSH